MFPQQGGFRAAGRRKGQDAVIHDTLGEEELEPTSASDGLEVEPSRMLEEVRRSEQRFRALVEAAHEYAIMILDREGRVVNWNPGAERLLGYAPEEIQGLHFSRFFQPEEIAAGLPERELETAEKVGRADDQNWLVRRNGSCFWADGVTTPLRDPEGRIWGFAKVVRDTTEHRGTEELLRRQQAALVELTRNPALVSGDLKVALAQITEADARTLDLERVGIWLFDAERTRIRCVNLFERSPGRHTDGLEISRSDYPAYFQALKEERVIAADDAQRDPRTREFTGSYLSLLGITSMLDAPIRYGGKTVGIVCHEHVGRPRHWTAEEQSFAGSVADMVSLALEVAERRRAEEAVKFLARAGEEIASSLDYETTLERVARLAVSFFADVCLVDLVEEDGTLVRIATAHADPALEEKVTELRRFPPDPQAPSGVAHVLRTGKPVLHPEISAETLSWATDDPEHQALLRELGVSSGMVVPLRVRGRTLGAITFAYAGSGRRYDTDDLALARDLARRAAQAIDNARLYRRQLRTAHTLQQSLLPSALPELPGIRLAARYLPAGEGLEVGGDFYDVFTCKEEGVTAILLGDVSGKGVTAAAVTALTRYTARAVAPYETEPDRILARLNQAILDQTDTTLFVTAVLACIEITGGGARLTMASGGHPPPLRLRRDGTVEPLGRPGLILGISPSPPLPLFHVELERGDTLVFYTDGVIEARIDTKLFGEERLAALVRDCRGLEVGEIAARIERAAVEFQNGNVRDDIAVLVLRIMEETGNGSNMQEESR